jgi:hypothetical protein
MLLREASARLIVFSLQYIGNGNAVEFIKKRSGRLYPDITNLALRRPGALFRRADTGHKVCLSFEQADNPAEGYNGRRCGQHVPAFGATDAIDQAGLFQRADQQFDVLHRNALMLGYGTDLNGLIGLMPRQLNQNPDTVAASSG